MSEYILDQEIMQKAEELLKSNSIVCKTEKERKKLQKSGKRRK